MLAIYPAARIFTSVYHAPALSNRIRAASVHTTWLQRLPMVRKYSRALLPMMPGAFASLDLSAYDAAISVTTAFAKHLSLGPSTRHVCYCQTPPRYLWDLRDQYLNRPIGGPVLRGVAARLRDIDRRSADSVDYFVANSETVADRIRRAYEREATVIYPPVRTDLFRPVANPANDFYLVVSRLVGYKRIDLAVEACTRMQRSLVIVGGGPERKRLEGMAGPTIRFVGHKSDAEIAEMYANCRALLFPGLEDFGITPVETQAAGRPVIAFGQGGATETVVSGATGIFFEEQSATSLMGAIESFEAISFDPRDCRENAMRFDAAIFRHRLGQVVEAVVSGGVAP